MLKSLRERRLSRHSPPWLICIALLGGWQPAFAAPPKIGKPKDAPPAIERITNHVYRVGKALVDTEARTATVPGAINMDSGAIEYLAVTPKGKTHESLLRLNIRPLHLQVALLLLGLEPKNVLTHQGERATPQGDPVTLDIRWQDAQGRTQTVRAEEWIVEPSGKPMPTHNWVFTGSRIAKAGFEADLEGSIVAIWHDPVALLDNPLPGGANNGYLVNARRTPKPGTPIELIIRAVNPAAGKDASASGSGKP